MLRRLVVPAAIAAVVVASAAGIGHAAVPGGGGTIRNDGLAAPQGAAGGYVTLKAAAVGSADLVDESRSKGIGEANVTHPLTGIWCVSGLGGKLHSGAEGNSRIPPSSRQVSPPSSDRYTALGLVPA